MVFFAGLRMMGIAGPYRVIRQYNVVHRAAFPLSVAYQGSVHAVVCMNLTTDQADQSTNVCQQSISGDGVMKDYSTLK